MTRLVLNMGMHKTGSSSIQQNLKELNTRQAAYLNVGHPNQSAVYSTMFMEEPETYSAHRKNSRSVEQVAELRALFRERFEEQIALHDGKTLLSSAEDIGLMSENEVIAMRDWLKLHFDEVLIVGYARPPVSFMASALQQRMAGGVRIGDLFPPYRERFEKFDRVFGRENVLLSKFDCAHLKDGDVVADFVDKAGLSLPSEQWVKDNEGRSLEATAIMYAQRKLGRGFVRYPKAPRDNSHVVNLLRSIGETKVNLHSDFLDNKLETRKADLDWMAERLGVEFVDFPTDPDGALHSLDDLLPEAGRHLPNVIQVLLSETQSIKDSDPEFVARAVDLLLDVVKYKRENKIR